VPIRGSKGTSRVETATNCRRETTAGKIPAEDRGRIVSSRFMTRVALGNRGHPRPREIAMDVFGHRRITSSGIKRDNSRWTDGHATRTHRVRTKRRELSNDTSRLARRIDRPDVEQAEDRRLSVPRRACLASRDVIRACEFGQVARSHHSIVDRC
jgi:hypothetical protein